MDPNVQNWDSHFPAILACLAVTKGDVLELGIGHNSTPQLHAYCVSSNRYLRSIERSPEWFGQFTHLQTQGHDLILSDYAAPPGQFGWSVVFIDQSPGGEERARSFREYIDSSEYLVVHDYWRENEAAIAPLLAGCNFHVCRKYEPPTLVASKKLPIPLGIKVL